jgi:uracil-DNA glycosylase
MFELAEIEPSWHSIFNPHLSQINSIFAAVDSKEITPLRKDVFRAFSLPIDKIKVVILGQDPYPGAGVADGLAFSTSTPIIPASLRNIFSEYCDDLGYPRPTSGDLTPWFHEGVLLLNTSLTTEVGSRDLHKSIGWQSLMSDVIEELASRKVVAILWGNSAKRFGRAFPQKIESVHPSPLSAHRGFFGSKPFTRANFMLADIGVDPVSWKLR